jgi:hypothetical protein
VEPVVKLLVTGCLVRKIIQQTEPIRHYYRYVGAPGQDAWLREQINLVQKADPYPTSEEVSSVLWRTLIGNLTFDENEASEEYLRYYDARRNLDEDISPIQRRMAKEFVDTVRRRSRYRRLCITQQGYIAGVPDEAKERDWICMFYGMRIIFVVRETDSNFSYIGHAYVHGLMHGEIFRLPDYKKCNITLI